MGVGLARCWHSAGKALATITMRGIIKCSPPPSLTMLLASS